MRARGSTPPGAAGRGSRRWPRRSTGRAGAPAIAEVDALDEAAVEAHLDAVVAEAGRIDILFNSIGMEDIQGPPLTDMAFEDFFRPIAKGARSQFLTARAAGRRMAAQGGGVLMTVTAGPPEAVPNIGGFGPACEMIEGLWRGLAAELSPKGVRVDRPALGRLAELERLPGDGGAARRRRRKWRRVRRGPRLQHADAAAAVGSRSRRDGGAGRVRSGERDDGRLRARHLRLTVGLRPAHQTTNPNQPRKETSDARCRHHRPRPARRPTG